ncbi:hypothetical protein [Corynebacterium heidelbergense]|uniref:Uncharacterized protein n=1 Tax=Corynebacterium heidelbergense TaxID=2055947 RepID=A0A364VEF4_9CORY|nr:hypothetical protein [Corynebacterium heidelbergense]RAV32951.1 hypothetical protein DLJ54_01075 [Corynebacterium heidelbergense]RAV35030.1 hypothetical protein CWC39_00205 [Corynebacterium heidelbergense]WCZ37422.1 hypothetical protein CHEID_09480 [Corynebacterium heidelbergense]
MPKITEDLYVDKLYGEGYVPSSFDSPHSSLHSSITWIGMGLVLSSLAGFGTMIFGLSGMVSDLHPWATNLAIGGAILGFGLLFSGFLAVHIGRKNYREYKKRTGRIH